MSNNIIPKILCIAYKDNVKIITGDEIHKEKVGAKAYGLSSVPAAWTLPFFVISAEMYEMYVSGVSIETIKSIWNASIIEAMDTMHFDSSQGLFIRSNMYKEDLADRGQFESYDCTIDNLFPTIKEYFDDIKDSEIIKTGVPLLIQQYSQTLGKGHISNEVRLSKEHRDWKGEIEQRNLNGTLIALDYSFSISLRNWRRKVVVNDNDATFLSCSSLKNVAQVLETPCAWATNQQIRIHFEWIFDGKYVYIVQADQEQKYGIDPMGQAGTSYHTNKSVFQPQVLHLLSSEDENRYLHYSKVRNPLIYNKLGLKTAPIYILEDAYEIQKLLNGGISEQLTNDLNVLAANPLVIRTDVDTEDQSLRQMLPRTDDIRNKEDAIEWLICTANELNQEHNGKLPFVFILHNFIPAFSSAFAYAEPNTRNVLFESLWGLPEGLYYYSHDKHVVDTKQQDITKVVISEISIIQKKINPKSNFVFPDVNGKWNYNPVSTDYIWRPAIPKEAWLKEIAINTRKISEYIGAGVSVMWFVGVDSKIYGCHVFPWHHEQFTYDSVPKHINRKKHRNDLSYTISHNTDIDKLQRIVQSGNRENIKYLLFKPIEENMIRNKDIIEKVGSIAKRLDAVITLEGGVLSHAYYQLKRTGVAVEVCNTFDSTVSNIEYDKLVRDKIPDKITRGGEIAITKMLSDDELLEQLRIKLVEEAFEVLEAKSTDDLIQELADVLEVIDSIIDKQKIQRESVSSAKLRKKEKAGGFERGIVLQKTALPTYRAANDARELSSQKEDSLSSWADKKEKTDYNETIRRLKIPLSLKQWNTQLTAKGLNKRPDIHVILTAKRVNASLHLEVSINEEFEQLTLYDD